MGQTSQTSRGGSSPAAEPADASTRDHILDTALRAFAEQGFDGASTRSIAARAGVNQGLIPYYFGTKQALWREAVDRAFETLHEALGELDLSSRDPMEPDEVARLVRRYVAFVAEHPEFVCLMNEEGKRQGPRMRWLVDRHVRPLFESIGGVFGRLGPTAERVPQVPDVHWSYVFVGAVATIFHQAPECRRVADYDPMRPEAVEAHADALVALFLGDPRLGRSEED